jgi:hypothetical protein
MVDLVRAGLASAAGERVVGGGKTIEVARMRITEAGRKALAEASDDSPPDSPPDRQAGAPARP